MHKRLSSQSNPIIYENTTLINFYACDNSHNMCNFNSVKKESYYLTPTEYFFNYSRMSILKNYYKV